MRYPGLLDLQVNGFRGWDVNADDVSAATVIELTRQLWSVGTSRYLPTVITGPAERMFRALSAIAEARSRDPWVAESIVGIHVEGPHISHQPGAKGAHEIRYMSDPDTALFDRWMEAAEGLIRIVTIAPERRGVPGYVRHLRERGVHVSLGHSCAEPGDVTRAVEAGATLSTHLGNGIPSQLPRHPNLIWTQLAEDDLRAMFILDGHHLPASAATAMLRAKGLERSLMVSDAAALAGSPPGEYVTPVGGRVIVGDDGALRLPNSVLLAGSGACLLDCLRWAAGALPFALDELWPLASEKPASLLGIDTSGDSLDIDESWRAREVRVAGTVVHKS